MRTEGEHPLSRRLGVLGWAGLFWAVLGSAVLGLLGAIPGLAQLADLTSPIQPDGVSAFGLSEKAPDVVFMRDGYAYVLVDDHQTLIRTLWRTDGTEEGSEPVLSRVERVLAHDEDDIFVVRRMQDGDSLWWTNGAPFSAGDHRPLTAIDDRSETEFLDEERILVWSAFNGQPIVVADRSTATTLTELDAEAGHTDHGIYWYRNQDVFVSDGTVEGIRRLDLPGVTVHLETTDRFAYLVQVTEGNLQIWRAEADRVEWVRNLGELDDLDVLRAAEDRVFWIEGDPRNVWELRDDAGPPSQATQRTFFTSAVSFRRSFDGREVTLADSVFTATASGIYFQNLDEAGDTRLWFLGNEQTGAQPLTFLCRECTTGFEPVDFSGDTLLFEVAANGGLWIARQPEGVAERIGTCGLDCGFLIPGYGYIRAAGTGPYTLLHVDPLTGASTPLLDLGYRTPEPLSGAFLPPSTLIVPLDEGDVWRLLVLDPSTGDSTSLGSWYPLPAAQQLVRGGTEELTYLLAQDRNEHYLASANADSLVAEMTSTERIYCGDRDQKLQVGDRMLCWNTQFLRSVDLSTGAVETVSDRDFLWVPIPLGSDRALILTSEVVDGEPHNFLSVTDGTRSGTHDLYSGDSTFWPMANTDSEAYLWLPGTDSDTVSSLLVSDGTTDGTGILNDALPRIQRAVPGPAALTDRWFYLFDAFADSPAIRVDRTTGALQSFASPHPAARRVETAVNEADTLFFVTSQNAPYQLLAFDDHADTPVEVGPSWTDPFLRSPRASRLDGRTIIEDRAGLVVVTDAGQADFYPLDVRHPLVELAGRGFFTALTAEHGLELMSISADGRAPRIAHDIHPGPPSSRADQLTVVGDALYFTADDGIHGQEIWVITHEQAEAGQTGCRPTESSLCLNQDRFKVDIAWQGFEGDAGRGRSRPVTDDTGAFWFFDDANLESVVKVLDGTAITGHYWTFFGSLTNLGFALTVTDADSGLARRYLNPPGNFASLGDTTSLVDLAQSVRRLAPHRAPEASTRLLQSTAEPCRTGEPYLCLQGERFELSVTWRDFSGHEGIGTARPLEDDTGAFWFFDDANLELVIKVLDATEINDRFWVYFGSLTSVAFELTVRDTLTGAVRVYDNPLGEFASVGDITAFPAAPP